MLEHISFSVLREVITKESIIIKETKEKATNTNKDGRDQEMGDVMVKDLTKGLQTNLEANISPKIMGTIEAEIEIEIETAAGEIGKATDKGREKGDIDFI